VLQCILQPLKLRKKEKTSACSTLPCFIQEKKAVHAVPYASPPPENTRAKLEILKLHSRKKEKKTSDVVALVGFLREAKSGGC
jgi:hypothetical protein